MKDEIKEILDYLKKEVNKFEESKTYLIETYNYREQDIENIEQHKKYVYFKKLLDYITNLQEENKRLEEERQNINNRNCNQRIANKKLMEDIERLRTNLKTHKRRRKKQTHKKNIYKSRCEKAIQRELELSYLCDTQPDEELLNILGGKNE